MTDIRTWRVGHHGRDMMYYEERVDGRWQRIEISGEMLMGRAHQVIYFTAASDWHRQPEWARHRRDEIIRRIKSEFREPEYEYHESGGTTPTRPSDQGASAHPAASHSSPEAPGTPRERRTLDLVLLLMLVLAAVMSVLVVRGITSGETMLPLARATLRSVVVRAQEPAAFWTSIGLYVAIGAGALGLFAWGLRFRRTSR